jgi:uridine kinase
MLKITITGMCGDGKTTVASEIAALLESLKMKVIIKDIDLAMGHSRTSANHEQCVKCMEGRQIEIETIQTRRVID